MESEFWGIEVKPGKTVKCEPGHKVLHLSQASLGETKDKGSEKALIFLKANDQKLVIGTLCADKCAQINYDLVFEKDFELSHSSKNSSVYFCGYKAIVDEDSYSVSSDSDSDSEDKDIQHGLQPKGIPEVKEAQTKPKSLQPESAKGCDSLAKPNPKAVEPNKADKNDDGLSSDDEDVTDSEDESDDEDDDEATPKKAGVGEKRPAAGSPSETPVPPKKANQKTDGDGGKKGSEHIATPHPTKDKGKAPANDDKPKIIYSTCKACNRKFNSGKTLDSHSEAKHSNEK